MTTTNIAVPHDVRVTIAASIEAGAEFLDSVNKSWYETINQRQLELSSGEQCVLGQIGQALTDEGRYNTFSYESFIGAKDEDYFADGCVNPRLAAGLVMSDTEARERGFNIHPAVDTWRDELAKGLTSPDYYDTRDKALAVVWGMMNDLWKKQIRMRVAANA